MTMDSALNGDVNSTTILMVGDGEVGGAAGFTAAFVLTPNDQFQFLKSAKLVNGQIALELVDGNAVTLKKVVAYDSAKNILRMK